MMMWTSILLSFVLAISGQVAASDNATDAAVFVFNSSSTDQAFLFALNAGKSSGDLYFHLEAPSGQAWTAVGIGSEMKGALIFAAYASENGTGVTVSPRLATRHAEPSYDKNVHLELVWPSWSNESNTIGTDGILRADAVCRNCTSWLSGQGQLDLTSKSVPFIFAMGPAQTMHSSSLTASMRRHSYYGHFNMDMTAATSPDKGSVPSPNGKNSTYQLQYASTVKDMTSEDSIAPAAHALIMIAAFVFVFPFGSLVLKILHKALWHGAVQVLGLLMVLVGFGLGIYLSTEYNKVSNPRLEVPLALQLTTFFYQSKHFASAHQLIGLLILISLLVQLGLGLLHHRTWKQTKSPTKFSKIHKYLGPAIVLLGLINGGIGFSFAGNSSYHGKYIVIVLAVAIGYSGVRGILWWWTSKRKQRKQNQQQQWVGEGYQHPQFGPQDPYPGNAVPLKAIPGR